jgi:hypothetical protein
MISPVRHWGSREWQRNQDLLVPDPEHPQAFPGKCPTDLMGRIRVWLTAEDRSLVAHGFGGQRIVLPSASVGAVHTVSQFRTGRVVTHGRALLVLDHQRRILLRASGLWQTYGELNAVCRAAKAPSASHLTPYSATRSNGRPRKAGTTRKIPRFEKAPGYRRLRTTARGTTLRVLALTALLLLTACLGAFVGALPAVALPPWFGAVRTLIGIAGALLGAAGGIWLGAAIAHLIADALRWVLTSWSAGTLAPPRRFLRRRDRPGGRSIGWNLGLAALVPALIGWGPGVGIASLSHGLRDSALVAELRSQGAQIPGRLIDVQQFSTDDDGNTTVTDVPTLAFLGWRANDPSIGGRPLPLDADDPLDTSVPVTVVYLPADPDTAAAEQQLAGSVWHGAPTANLISGGLLTLALPPVLWLLVLRVRRRRWLRAKELVDDLGS